MILSGEWRIQEGFLKGKTFELAMNSDKEKIMSEGKEMELRKEH